MNLQPFFTYYGGKFRAGPAYPESKHPIVIEPFAGSAGYSLHHPNKLVVLNEKNPVVVGIWRYLLKATEAEILALPDIPADGSVDDFNIPQEAKWLIGFLLNAGVASPCKKPSAWMRKGHKPMVFWGEQRRNRIARQLQHIRHWIILEGGYEDLDARMWDDDRIRTAYQTGDDNTLWFIDPPYDNAAGRCYPVNEIDYGHLADWCKARRGGVIVCEQHGADWLPFRPFGSFKSNPAGGSKTTNEVVWSTGVEYPGDLFGDLA